MPIDQHTDRAIQEIDAAVFSGDAFVYAAHRATLRDYMARWERALKEFDADDGE